MASTYLNSLIPTNNTDFSFGPAEALFLMSPLQDQVTLTKPGGGTTVISATNAPNIPAGAYILAACTRINCATAGDAAKFIALRDAR